MYPLPFGPPMNSLMEAGATVGTSGDELATGGSTFGNKAGRRTFGHESSKGHAGLAGDDGAGSKWGGQTPSRGGPGLDAGSNALM